MSFLHDIHHRRRHHHCHLFTFYISAFTQKPLDTVLVQMRYEVMDKVIYKTIMQ